MKKNRYSVKSEDYEANVYRMVASDEATISLHTLFDDDYFFNNLRILQAIKREIVDQLDTYKDKLSVYSHISRRDIYFTSPEPIYKGKKSLYKGEIQVLSDKLVVLKIRKEFESVYFEYTHWCHPDFVVKILMQEVQYITDSINEQVY